MSGIFDLMMIEIGLASRNNLHDFERGKKLKEFVDMCSELSNLIASHRGNATYQTDDASNSKIAERLNPLNLDLHIMKIVIQELDRLNSEELSQVEEKLDKIVLADAPNPSTRLAVTMPDGTVIKHKNASDTFVEVIDELGRRKVKNLDLKVNGKDLMSTSEDDQQRRKLGGYLINVGISTERKKRVLEDIASRLDVELNVEIIPK